MDTMQALEQRKSVRNYKNETVDTDKLNKLVFAATHAPNAGEYQVTVLTNPALIQGINDKALTAMKNSGNDFLMQRAALPGYQPLYGAPLLILFSAPDGPYGMANASCAATSVCIAATALDLGSCYVVTPTLALAEDAILRQKAGISEGYTTFCGVLAGYAAGDAFSAQRPQNVRVNYCK